MDAAPTEASDAPVVSLDAQAQIGAGVTGAVAGGILADAAVSAAGVGLTGEVLTDAAAANVRQIRWKPTLYRSDGRL